MLRAVQVLTSVGLCTLEMLLAPGPLDEQSAVFVAAGALLGLEHLHHSRVMFRCVGGGVGALMLPWCLVLRI